MRRSEEIQRRNTSKTIQPNINRLEGSEGAIEEEISNAVITSRRESKIDTEERDQRILGTAKAKKTGSLLDNERDRAGTLKLQPSRDNYLTNQSGNKSLRELTVDGGSNYTEDAFDEISMSKSYKNIGLGLSNKDKAKAGVK